MTRTLAAALFLTACTHAGSSSPSTDPGKADGDGCTPGASGTLDTCFGFAKGPALSQTLYAASTVQSDDKILVFGNGYDASVPGYRPFLQRFLATGAADTTFQAQFPAPQGSAYFRPTALVVAHDHRLLLTGEYGDNYYHSYYLLSLLPDGGTDTTGWAGAVQIPNASGSTGTKIILASDDSIYVAGTTECIAAFTCDTKSMFVAHYDSTGKLDTSYGTNGYAQLTAGPHTMVKDAVLTADGIDLLGLESEPIWVAGQQSSFDRVVVGALDATGKPRAGFGNAGVFSWYGSSAADQYGSIGQAFHVAADGTITVASALPTDQLLTIGPDGQLKSTHEYYKDVGASLEPHFADDGSIFATVKDFPSPRFAHFAADGTPDAAFQSSDVQVPGLPDGSAILDTDDLETSDAWLVTAHLYLANQNPDDELLLFRVWK